MTRTYRAFSYGTAILAVACSVLGTGWLYVRLHVNHVGYVYDGSTWGAWWRILSLWFVVSGVSLGAAYTTRLLRDSRLRILLACLAGLLLAAWLVTQPLILSSDVFRYLWDGRLLDHGVNPFAYTPDDPALQSFQNWNLWPYLQYKTWTTAYPPGAQYEFVLAVRFLGDRIMAWKGVQWVNYAVTILVFIHIQIAKNGKRLPFWLALQQLSRTQADQITMLALFSPLLIEGIGAGHVDLAAVPFMLVAWFMDVRKRPVGVGVCLAIATSIKLYPIVLLASVIRLSCTRYGLRVVGSFFVALLLLVAPFLSQPAKLIGYEVLFRHFHYNDSLQTFLHSILGAASAKISTLVGAVLVLGVGVTFIVSRRIRLRMEQKAALLLLTVFLVSPAVYPWYLLGLIPFAIGSSYPVLLWWCIAACLAYTQVIGYALLEYIPVYGWLVGNLVRVKARSS